MKTACSVLLVATLALSVVGCTAPTPEQRALRAQRAETRRTIQDFEMRQRTAQQAAMNAIIVTPGDLPSRKYEILGSVDYPGRGVTLMSLVGPPSCGPDNARKAALEHYSHVDAIIGFTQWRDGSTPHCGGTAVRFTE